MPDEKTVKNKCLFANFVAAELPLILVYPYNCFKGVFLKNIFTGEVLASGCFIRTLLVS